MTTHNDNACTLTEFTISGETLERLELAQDMMRRANLSSDISQIIDRALTLLLTDLAKKE